MRSQTIFTDFSRIYPYSIEAIVIDQLGPIDRREVAKIFFGCTDTSQRHPVSKPSEAQHKKISPAARHFLRLSGKLGHKPQRGATDHGYQRAV
jgi:hypothetical protein